MTMITLTTGTAFIMWLGEQITERGIGNGISLIIFAGIVTDMPDGVVPTTSQIAQGQDPAAQPVAVAAIVLVDRRPSIVFFERGQRRIPIHYARRTVGRSMYGGQTLAPAAARSTRPAPSRRSSRPRC